MENVLVLLVFSSRLLQVFLSLYELLLLLLLELLCLLSVLLLLPAPVVL